MWNHKINNHIRLLLGKKKNCHLIGYLSSSAIFIMLVWGFSALSQPPNTNEEKVEVLSTVEGTVGCVHSTPMKKKLMGSLGCICPDHLNSNFTELFFVIDVLVTCNQPFSLVVSKIPYHMAHPCMIVIKWNLRLSDKPFHGF